MNFGKKKTRPGEGHQTRKNNHGDLEGDSDSDALENDDSSGDLD